MFETQLPRGVTRLDGARGKKKFGASMFEPVFRKQMCCIEESNCDIVETFRRPGNCAPPRYAPASALIFSF